MEIGALVQYYDDGWRYGYLVEIEHKTVRKGKKKESVATGRTKIRPIAAFRKGTPHCVWVRTGDVKESEIS